MTITATMLDSRVAASGSAPTRSTAGSGATSAPGQAGLEDRSHRPRQVRQPTWSRELEDAILELREQYVGWGKDKPGRARLG